MWKVLGGIHLVGRTRSKNYLNEKAELKTSTLSILTDGDVRINMASFRFFKLSVFVSSSSCSSLGPIWMEFCRDVKLRLSIAPPPDAPKLPPSCGFVEDRRKGHDILLQVFHQKCVLSTSLDS